MAVEDNRYINFWPDFDANGQGSRLVFDTLGDQTIGSVFGPGARTHILFSGESVSIHHDGECFVARRNGTTYLADFFIGIPKISHPHALHVPLFYLSWASDVDQRQQTDPAGARSFGIGAVIRNLTEGNLARRRAKLVHELSLFVPVHASHSLRAAAPSWSRVTYHHVTDKWRFLSRYTHNLCFENTARPGYITEKIFDALSAGCLPLYDGDPGVTEWFSEDAYVNCSRLSAQAIAEKTRPDDKLLEIVQSKREGLCLTSLEEMRRRIHEFNGFVMNQRRNDNPGGASRSARRDSPKPFTRVFRLFRRGSWNDSTSSTREGTAE
jgi:hypothetical protein